MSALELKKWRITTMAAFSRAVPVLLAAFIMSSCVSSVPYKINSQLTRDEAQAILRQVFEEQPAGLRPVSVEVGDDALRLGFSMAQKSFTTGGVAAIDRRETYYYRNLADLDLVSNKGRIVVKLSNREGSVRRWVYVYDEAKGGAFISALKRFQSAN
jgi:hypothetical protein